jgi:hypothetical protein
VLLVTAPLRLLLLPLPLLLCLTEVVAAGVLAAAAPGRRAAAPLLPLPLPLPLLLRAVVAAGVLLVTAPLRLLLLPLPLLLCLTEVVAAGVLAATAPGRRAAVPLLLLLMFLLLRWVAGDATVWRGQQQCVAAGHGGHAVAAHADAHHHPHPGGHPCHPTAQCALTAGRPAHSS